MSTLDEALKPGVPTLAQYAIHLLFHNSEPDKLCQDAVEDLDRIAKQSGPVWGVFTTIHRSPG